MTFVPLHVRHRDRALAAIAGRLCARHFTDGFCGPDGCDPRSGRPRCRRAGTENGDCVAEAEGVMAALSANGMVVAWAYDRELPPSLQTLLKLVGDGTSA